MRKIRIFILMLLIILLAVPMVACDPENGEETTNGVTVSTPDESSDEDMINDMLEAVELENKEVRILSHYEMGGEILAEAFDSFYGGEISYVLIGAGEYLTRLSAMEMSQDSPDLVVRSSLDHQSFLLFVSNDLVQPVNEFIDTDKPIWKDLKEPLENVSLFGKQYFVPRSLNVGSVIVYNRKLFEDNGVETPWELYERGEWDWNAFKEAAFDMTLDTNMDGNINVFGSIGSEPDPWIRTTGATFISLEDDEITLNIRSDDISRSMNFIHDLLFREETMFRDPHAWSPLLTRDRLAMYPALTWQITQPEMQSLAKDGNLGVAPYPRDPQSPEGTHYVSGELSGFLIPKGAENVQGAISFIKTVIYMVNYDEENVNRWKDSWLEMGYTQENIDRYEHIRNMEDIAYDMGYGFMHGDLWGYLDQEQPWETYLETIAPSIEANFNEVIQGLDIG